MIDSCKHLTIQSCLLRQLAEGTAAADTTRCEHCDATLNALDVDLNQIGDFQEAPSDSIANDSIAHEDGYQLAGKRAWEALRALQPDREASQRVSESSGGLQMRCPHCAKPVSLEEGSSLAALDCPSCGEHFRLIDEEEACDLDMTDRRIGHFELVERVGAGSFGVVWRAFDSELDRTVAIKIPRRTQLSAREIERFVHEARASAALHHPNIVSVYEIGRQADSVFIVSDFIDGLTLDEYLADQLLTAKEAATLCATIADALHHAHEQGVVHRDLKPGNIGIDHRLQPHIMDFGLALRSSTEMTMTADGKILGTPAYMPPEQARGDSHTADRRSDIYSLGVMLFEMLTGERPFRGSMRMMLQQIVNEEPPNPQRLNSAIPRDLATICLKCLEKPPERRYQTAEQLSLDLRRFLDRRPIAARPVSAIERGWRWCRRNPLPATLTSLLFASLAIGVTISSWKWAEAAMNARKAGEEEARAQQAAATMQQQSAEMFFDRGEALCQDGETAEGLNWLSQSLLTFPEGEGERWKNTVRANINAWLEETPRLRHRLEIAETITAILPSPTDDLLAVGCMGGVVYRVDLRTGETLGSTAPEKVYEAAFSVLSMDFHPSGDHLLVARGTLTQEQLRGTVSKIDAHSGERLQTLFSAPGTVNDVCYSRKAHLIAIGGGADSEDRGLLWFVDANTGEVVGPRVELFAIPRHMQFVADDKKLVVHAGKQVLGIDVTTHEIARFPLGEQPIETIVWHPNGERFAIAHEDATVSLWEYPQLTKIGTPIAHSGTVRSLTYHPDGGGLVVNDRFGMSSFVDTTTQSSAGSRLRSYGQAHWNWRGDQIAAFSKRQIQIWDGPASRTRSTPTDQATGGSHFAVATVDISPDLRRAVHGSEHHIATLINPATSLPVGAPLEHPLPNVRATALSPDGQLLATSCLTQDAHTCFVRLWDAVTGEPRSRWVAQSNWVLSLSFSADGSLLATGDYSANVRVWDVATMKPVGEVMHNPDIVIGLKFHPDGTKLIAGLADSWTGKPRACLWDTATASQLGDPMPHDGWVSLVGFSPDGSQAFTATPDGLVKLWDSATTKQVGDSIPYSPGLGVAEYTPDGQRLLTGGTDGVVRLWNTGDGSPIEGATMAWSDDSVRSLAVAPDNRHFLVGLNSGRCQLCDMATFARIGPPLRFRTAVVRVRWSTDGSEYVVVSTDGSARHQHLTALEHLDDNRLAERVARSTGMRFDVATRTAISLGPSEWNELSKEGSSYHEKTALAAPDSDPARPARAKLASRLADSLEDRDNFATRIYAEALARQPSRATQVWQPWQLAALRADLDAAEHQWEQARRGYEQIELAADDLGDAVQDWLHQQASRAMRDSKWQLARWYLDLLIEKQPATWTFYRDRAQVLHALGEAALREHDLTSALKLDASPEFRISVAKEWTEAGRWPEALQLFELAHQEGFVSDESMQYHVAVALVVQPEETSTLVNKLLEFVDSTPLTLGLGRRVVSNASYCRVEDEHAERLLQISQLVVNNFSEDQAFQKGAELLQRGMLLSRLGDHDEAISTITKSTELMNQVTQKHLLAFSLAHARRGDLDQAQTYVDQLEQEQYRNELADICGRLAFDALLNELKSLGVN